jgi:hypothetical protein
MSTFLDSRTTAQPSFIYHQQQGSGSSSSSSMQQQEDEKTNDFYFNDFGLEYIKPSANNKRRPSSTLKTMTLSEIRSKFYIL